MEVKKCPKCKSIKISTEYSTNNKRKDGLEYQCKECRSEYRNKRYKNDPSICRKHVDTYISKNKEMVIIRALVSGRKFRKNNVEKNRESVRKSTEKRKEYYLNKRLKRRFIENGYDPLIAELKVDLAKVNRLIKQKI